MYSTHVLATNLLMVVQAKAEHANNELVTDDAAGSAHIFNFASRIFDAADRADRDGKASR